MSSGRVLDTVRDTDDDPTPLHLPVEHADIILPMDGNLLD
jgi:hypothetical protein